MSYNCIPITWRRRQHTLDHVSSSPHVYTVSGYLVRRLGSSEAAPTISLPDSIRHSLTSQMPSGKTASEACLHWQTSSLKCASFSLAVCHSLPSAEENVLPYTCVHLMRRMIMTLSAVRVIPRVLLCTPVVDGVAKITISIDSIYCSRIQKLQKLNWSGQLARFKYKGHVHFDAEKWRHLRWVFSENVNKHNSIILMTLTLPVWSPGDLPAPTIHA